MCTGSGYVLFLFCLPPSLRHSNGPMVSHVHGSGSVLFMLCLAPSLKTLQRPEGEPRKPRERFWFRRFLLIPPSFLLPSDTTTAPHHDAGSVLFLLVFVRPSHVPETIQQLESEP